MAEKGSAKSVLADLGIEILAGSLPTLLASVAFVVAAELFRVGLGRLAKQKFGNKGE